MTQATKTCRGCHVEKPITEFYVHPQMGDGRLNHCKECKVQAARKYYAQNLDDRRAYDRARAMLPHRVEARRAYAQTDACKRSAAKAKRAYLATNPVKRAAHVMVGNRVRDKSILKAPCMICGSTRRTHGHHDNYARPLDVVWLCPSHHAERHKSLRWGK